MNTKLIKVASLIALMVAILPSLLFFAGTISIETMKWIMLGGTIAWFVITPAWLGRESKAETA